MLKSALNGKDLDSIYRSGVVGFASGMFTASGGFGLVKQGFAGRLGFRQSVQQEDQLVTIGQQVNIHYQESV